MFGYFTEPFIYLHCRLHISNTELYEFHTAKQQSVQQTDNTVQYIQTSMNSTLTTLTSIRSNTTYLCYPIFSLYTKKTTFKCCCIYLKLISNMAFTAMTLLVGNKQGIWPAKFLFQQLLNFSLKKIFGKPNIYWSKLNNVCW